MEADMEERAPYTTADAKAEIEEQLALARQRIGIAVVRLNDAEETLRRVDELQAQAEQPQGEYTPTKGGWVQPFGSAWCYRIGEVFADGRYRMASGQMHWECNAGDRFVTVLPEGAKPDPSCEAAWAKDHPEPPPDALERVRARVVNFVALGHYEYIRGFGDCRDALLKIIEEEQARG